MKPTTRTTDEARQLDAQAEQEFGIPSLLLMESAGRQLADAVQKNMIPPIESCRIVFLCGTGNNGGDGFTAARYLAQRRIPFDLFLIGDCANIKNDAAINYRIISKLGIPIHPFEKFAAKRAEWDRRPVLIVDAMLGTGYQSPLRAPISEAIRQVNEFKKFHTSYVRIVAADVPSGLDGDHGVNGQEAIRADITVTFACYKPGLLKPESRPYVGRLELVDIGIPDVLVQNSKQGG